MTTTTTPTTTPRTSAAGGVAGEETAVTDAVVRRHLQAFLEQLGLDALIADYRDDARLYTEDRIYRGKREIRAFFGDFVGALPPGGIHRFALSSLHVEGNVALISWSVGSDIPLGTDTFLVHDGQIVAQTFAMCTRDRQRSLKGPKS